MNKRQVRNALLLLLTATIWGVAFVAQRVGMDYVGPFTFTSVRMLIGGVTLLPVIAISGRRRGAAATKEAGSARTLVIGGVLCGVVLFGGSSLQQIALQEASAGKAGFITAMYIVIVPILGLLFKRKVGRLTWLGVFIALVGLYFLCMTERFTVDRADVLLFLGSVVFAVHILVIDHFTQLVDGLKMSCIQLFTCAILAAIPMGLFEKPTLHAIASSWLPILYAGMLSCGVGYTLQIIAQRGMNPTIASLILSLESVMAVLAGWLILGQALTSRELIGCALMFGAIILAQLPARGSAQSSIDEGKATA